MTTPADNTTPPDTTPPDTTAPDATPTEGTPGEAPTTTPEATPGAAAPTEPLSPEATEMRNGAIAALREIYDPEIPVDIYELGLIYEVTILDDAAAYVKMTLTTPMCPVAEILPVEVEEKVRTVEGIDKVDLDLVWDPPWDVDMMSEAARLELNF